MNITKRCKHLESISEVTDGIELALFVQGFRGLRDLAQSLLASLTVAFLCAVVHRYLMILYVSIPDPVSMADMHLQLQDPQRLSRSSVRVGNIFLAVSFPNLLQLLPPTSLGSVRADTITNFAVFGSDSETQHLPDLNHIFRPVLAIFPGVPHSRVQLNFQISASFLNSGAPHPYILTSDRNCSFCCSDINTYADVSINKIAPQLFLCRRLHHHRADSVLGIVSSITPQRVGLFLQAC